MRFQRSVLPVVLTFAAGCGGGSAGDGSTTATTQTETTSTTTRTTVTDTATTAATGEGNTSPPPSGPPPSAAMEPTPHPVDPADACAILAARARTAPMDLLGGHLRIASVDGAADSPVPWNVMSAPDAPTDRSRIYYEAPPHGLAVVGTEMYMRAGPDFVATATRELSQIPDGGVIELPTGDPAMRLVAWLPSAIRRNQETAFLLIGLLAHPDGSVQKLQIGTFSATARDLARCRNLGRELARTAVPGTRSLAAPAGPRPFTGPRGAARATVPAGWVLTTQDGPDFVVHRFRLLSDFPTAGPQLGIYVGDHPSSDPLENVTGQRAGRIFGQQVTWDLATRTNPDGTTLHIAETRAPVGPRRIHAWINTPDPATLDAAMAIAASIR